MPPLPFAAADGRAVRRGDGQRVAMRDNTTLTFILTDHLGSTALTATSTPSAVIASGRRPSIITNTTMRLSWPAVSAARRGDIIAIRASAAMSGWADVAALRYSIGVGDSAGVLNLAKLLS